MPAEPVPPVAESSARPRDFVQSLERGLAIIRVFSAERPSLTVTEIAESTGLTRAASRRFLLTLVELGYVATDGRYYELTPRVLELGYAFLSGLSFPEVALPRLERLVGDVGEASEAAILDGSEIVYVVRVPGPALMTISVNIGARMPAHATAMGRVLLAGLDDAQLDEQLAGIELQPIQPRTIVDRALLREEIMRIRQQGWALVDQELEEGLVAIAVPVRDRSGRVTAAINLSTHVGRRSAKELLEILPDLQRTAAEIEGDLAVSTASSNRRMRI
ncbi:Pca regulon regulatory protein PcaR [Patulibacter medicamentivorans]|jgi:IclR family pca regulon transcriptional regulator|uniref:Glycerol operon regulatory protein n=1 Tax=Patulibacter medicamentivorans TaxID=1097667 RepID=H0E7U9_9ACTN|nr:IclR family transcriptional regulator C-terminal domain-containing protein [Patulibacter medicamentivorans]EHN10239.1 Pca regulon regulatory protein PcaR [Patulibacter medicamentivorans]